MLKKFFLTAVDITFIIYTFIFLLVNEIQKLVPVIYFRFLLLFFTLLRSKNFFKNAIDISFIIYTFIFY